MLGIHVEMKVGHVAISSILSLGQALYSIEGAARGQAKPKLSICKACKAIEISMSDTATASLMMRGITISALPCTDEHVAVLQPTSAAGYILHEEQNGRQP